MQEAIKSAFLRLNSNDWIKGLEMVVLVSILGAVQEAYTTYGLAVTQYDWGTIEKVAITAGLGYVIKNLMTAENGKLFGKI